MSIISPIEILANGMAAARMRVNTLASNIANAETPQYRAIDVSFGNELEKAFEAQNGSLAQTNSAHIDTQSNQGDTSSLVPDLSGPTKPDGNNVDLDLQMGRLAQNSGDYANAARLIRRQIGLLRTAIRETR